MCHTFAEGRREAAAGCPSGPHREVGLWRRHLRGRKDRTPSCLAPPSLRETDWKDVKKCEKIQKLCQLWCSPSVPSVLKKHQETISSDLHVPFLLEEITHEARCTQAGVQQWRLTVTTKAQVQGYDGCGDQTLSVGKKKVWACLGYPAITN